VIYRSLARCGLVFARRYQKYEMQPPLSFDALASALLHDAALNTAMIWKNVWDRVR
jgi:hypothetical protein